MIHIIVTVTCSLSVCIKLEFMCNILYTVSIVSSVVIVPSWSHNNHTVKYFYYTVRSRIMTTLTHQNHFLMSKRS